MVRGFEVAVLHDFYVDRLVHRRNLRDLLGTIRMTSESGGGSIQGVDQEEIRGGNAVNLAYALARLGLRTLLITHSDDAHRALLLEGSEDLDLEVRIKPLPPALTVAFEGRANVMLGHSGGAGDFGPERLEDPDWTSLARSGVVCAVNWAANTRGTELLGALRKRLGSSKTIFCDPADFRHRPSEFRKLLELVRKRRLIDWISMNEHEAVSACRLLGIGDGNHRSRCMELSKILGIVVDVHSRRGAYSADGETVTQVPSKTVRPLRLTGAGDVWDAGAVYGRITGLSERARLEFANVAAMLYLRSDPPLPPSLDEVLQSL